MICIYSSRDKLSDDSILIDNEAFSEIGRLVQLLGNYKRTL